MISSRRLLQGAFGHPILFPKMNGNHLNLLFRRGKTDFLACFLLISLLCLTGCSSRSVNEETKTTAEAKKACHRIISTVPSITEVLFDIGAGDRIVGDSAFTIYPPEAAKIDKIGGLYDKSYEKIVSLKPDLVICLIEDIDFQRRLTGMGIEILNVDHRSLDGLLDSYDKIGRRLGGEPAEQATICRQKLRGTLDGLAAEAAKLSTVKALVCVDRSRETGRIQNLFIAGNSPFYNEVLRLAGATNAAASIDLPYASLSVEGVIDLAPDVILDLQTGGNVDTKRALKDWNPLAGSVPAVKHGHVFVITDDYATIPGPRVALLVEKLMRTFAPIRPPRTIP